MVVAAVTRVRDLRSLGEVGKWSTEEVQEYASGVALEENRSQVRQGNVPSRVQVDGRGIDLTEQQGRQIVPGAGVRFVRFRRSIRFFYTDLSVLDEAFRYAVNQYQGLLPDKTGRGQETIYFWCNNPAGGSRKLTDVGSVSAWLAQQQSRNVSVHILGPLQEYRRTQIYSGPGSRVQWTSRSRDIERGGAARKVRDRVKVRFRDTRRGRILQVQIAKAVGALVAARVKRNYRDIAAGYGFIRSREGLPIFDKKWQPSGRNIHVPRIYLGIRRLRR